MKILVTADHDGSALKPATLNAVAAAQAFGGSVDLLIAGVNATAMAQTAAKITGLVKILACADARYDHGMAEVMAPLVARLARDYQAVCAPETTTGKNYLPRVAALLDVAQLSGVVKILAPDTFVRPIYAGNAMATVKSSDSIKLLTVRATAFPAVASDGGSAVIETVEPAEDPGLSRFVGEELQKSDRPELTSARIVISGGRGMQSGENFVMLERIADKIGAAVGASRAAVDAGFVPNDYQVGQTGKIVAPELYVAVGISGAIQHLAGMKDSKVIVAINKDEEAPIFQVADYGLVGDLFQILPELEAELSK